MADCASDDETDEYDSEEDGEFVEFDPDDDTDGGVHHSNSRQPFIGRQTDPVLQDQTAAQIIGDPTSYATFVCPVCGDIFDNTFRVYLFYRHLDTPLHWGHFASQGLMCQFDCGRGFLDETHRFLHYNGGSCPPMKRLAVDTSYICPEKTVKKCNIETLSTHTLTHWHSQHGKQYYKTPGSHNCSMCKLGFPSVAMLIVHLQQLYGGHLKQSTT